MLSHSTDIDRILAFINLLWLGIFRYFLIWIISGQHSVCPRSTVRSVCVFFFVRFGCRSQRSHFRVCVQVAFLVSNVVLLIGRDAFFSSFVCIEREFYFICLISMLYFFSCLSLCVQFVQLDARKRIMKPCTHTQTHARAQSKDDARSHNIPQHTHTHTLNIASNRKKLFLSSLDRLLEPHPQQCTQPHLRCALR